MISPEEYDHLAKFVDRLERKIISQHQSMRKVKEKQQIEALQSIPAGAYNLALADCNLPKKLLEILKETGYTKCS